MNNEQVTDESMKAKDVNFSVKGEPIEFTKPSTVNGIALEFADLKDYRALYFTPLSSKRIFYIYTTFLKSKKNISEYVHYLNSTPKTHTAGMIINSKNELFFGMLEDNSVGLWNSSVKPSEGFYKVAYSDPRLQWIDTYAIDVTGNMWVTINRLPRVNADKIDINEINYRVVKLDRQNSKNYQYYSDGNAPRLPVIKC